MQWASGRQRRYMNAAAARGEVPQPVVDERNRLSKGRKLPERANPKKNRADFARAIARKRRYGV